MEAASRGSTPAFLNKLLDVVEFECVPVTAKSVEKGNKLFGAAILKTSDLSSVCVDTNTETECPLWHGEVACIRTMFNLPESDRPPAKECFMIATHEPCSMCTSAIAWSGFPEVYSLFSYEDTRDAFNIPHDIKMLQDVFGCDRPNQNNIYFTGYSISALVEGVEDSAAKEALKARLAKLKTVYHDLSETYQRCKEAGHGGGIALA